jgi:hypothetical protein
LDIKKKYTMASSPIYYGLMATSSTMGILTKVSADDPPSATADSVILSTGDGWERQLTLFAFEDAADNSSSSSSEFESDETEEYDAQIIHVILADQSGHHNLIPFSFAIDNNVFSGANDSLAFSYSNASYLSYSNIYPTNGEIQPFVLSSSGATYVPRSEDSKYIHTSEIYVDIISSNVDSISTTFASNRENGLHSVDIKEAFVTPKFSWTINIVEIPASVNTYGTTLSGGSLSNGE